MDEDPPFALRIIVDIAMKALSPAINDPTTAVLGLDQLHRLLREIGRRELDPGRACDAAGELRLLYPTPDWSDFVALATTEIRMSGAESPAVTRRITALLEELMGVLPEPRVGRLREELECSAARSPERRFVDPHDARVAAAGGSSRGCDLAGASGAGARGSEGARRRRGPSSVRSTGGRWARPSCREEPAEEVVLGVQVRHARPMALPTAAPTSTSVSRSGPGLDAEETRGGRQQVGADPDWESPACCQRGRSMKRYDRRSPWRKAVEVCPEKKEWVESPLCESPGRAQVL